ncbi:MAG: helix-turn-helix transcriptional regulator [Candidatus Omnitrophota bacterium]|nr:helix-turn-helix transcriptional regulator [Candidatus Omnitrophota bacterium]
MKRRVNGAIIPESIGQHIEREYRRSKAFRKAYDEEVLKLRICYKIAQLRKSMHLTQQELAIKAHTTQQNISRLENPENSKISLHTLTKLAVALKARISLDLVPQE